MKKEKSSLSSSRLQYPLLMLLLLVMEGVSTVLTVMEGGWGGSLRTASGTRTAPGRHADELEEVQGCLETHSASVRVHARLSVVRSSRKSQRSSADASRERRSHLPGAKQVNSAQNQSAVGATGEGIRK